MSLKKNKVKKETKSEAEDLTISKALVMRAIERLKANDQAVTPESVGEILNVPKSFFYHKLELLDSIYRYGSQAAGPDAIIQELVSKLKSQQRKSERLQKKIVEAEIHVKKSYSDGFSEGAALSYKSGRISEVSDFEITEELWARGALFLDPEEILSEERVKSAYRKLIRIVHPDQSGSADLVHVLNKAYELLLEKYPV